MSLLQSVKQKNVLGVTALTLYNMHQNLVNPLYIFSTFARGSSVTPKEAKNTRRELLVVVVAKKERKRTCLGAPSHFCVWRGFCP
jgi:hypothetical protein